MIFFTLTFRKQLLDIVHPAAKTLVDISMAQVCMYFTLLLLCMYNLQYMYVIKPYIVTLLLLYLYVYTLRLITTILYVHSLSDRMPR